ncbi:shikimate kinase [Ascidiimonas sp. W6]|uniref:shikimate kinase n=1 Tax=Ascidiimonas meishanensis TaxID=3128903 RepID=UPI0030EBA4F6
MRLPFILIGLPGTGKTTLLNEVVQNLNSRNRNKGLEPLKLCSVDDLIASRMQLQDPIVKKFVTAYPEVKIFNDDNKVENATFIRAHGEDLFRVLEEFFLLDILENSNLENLALDLGGKSFLKEKVQDMALDKGLVPVFLFAENDEHIHHLGKNKEYTKRGNYKLAGEQGWEELAKFHKKERLPAMIRASRIVINISEPALIEKSKTKTKNPELTETIPSVLADELLFRVHEFSQNKKRRFNSYNNQTKKSNQKKKIS